MGRPKIDRTNEIGYNNNCEKMVIIRYGDTNDIDVQFEDGTILQHRRYADFKTGRVKNPMTPNVCGIGFIGKGKFKPCDENGKQTKCYETWLHMMQRCYNHKFQEKHPTYKGCKVCKEWWNFQKFAEWYYENYYEIGNERMMLDKDILHKGNKVYSPNTCVFVPQFINSLFTKSNNKRGKYPIGVSKYKNKYVAWLSKGNSSPIYLGLYTTPEEAFFTYKEAKEEFIKEVAEEYKQKIQHELYQAMMNYKVEIDD